MLDMSTWCEYDVRFGAPGTLFNINFFHAVAKFTHVKLGRIRQYCEDLNIYMRRPELLWLSRWISTSQCLPPWNGNGMHNSFGEPLFPIFLQIDWTGALHEWIFAKEIKVQRNRQTRPDSCKASAKKMANSHSLEQWRRGQAFQPKEANPWKRNPWNIQPYLLSIVVWWRLQLL